MPDNEPPDDPFEAAVRRLIERGRKRGYVTYDELNRVLPRDVTPSERFEDVIWQLTENGICLIEIHDPRDAANDNRREGAGHWRTSTNLVRGYLREINFAKPLLREEEIAIAKRIEAGREKTTAGLCESPLTATALLSWAEAMADGRMRLRDIGELETHPGGILGGGVFIRIRARLAAAELQIRRADEAEAVLDLRAMEAFARIGERYKKLSKAQDERLVILRQGGKLPPRLEARYEKLKGHLVRQIKRVRLDDARIKQLVEQHFHLNRRLLVLEGKLVYMAGRCGIERREFLKYYYRRELDPHWVSRVKRLPGKGWGKFADHYGETVRSIRTEIAGISEESRLPIHEFRRIAVAVGNGERETSTAKTEMTDVHLRLVIGIARDYIDCGGPFRDLIREGVRGLMKAVDTYDYRSGQSFFDHAEGMIRDAIVRAFAH